MDHFINCVATLECILEGESSNLEDLTSIWRRPRILGLSYLKIELLYSISVLLCYFGEGSSSTIIDLVFYALFCRLKSHFDKF